MDYLTIHGQVPENLPGFSRIKKEVIHSDIFTRLLYNMTINHGSEMFLLD